VTGIISIFLVNNGLLTLFFQKKYHLCTVPIFITKLKTPGQDSGSMSMTFLSRDLNQFINKSLQLMEEFLHKAVPAVSQRRMIPRWRNLGRPLTPYHFMQPALVPVRNNNKA
jgi:hypothetical protein